MLERIPVTWKRSLHVGSNWRTLEFLAHPRVTFIPSTFDPRVPGEMLPLGLHASGLRCITTMSRPYRQSAHAVLSPCG